MESVLITVLALIFGFVAGWLVGFNHASDKYCDGR